MSDVVLAVHCTLQADGQYAYDGNVALASRDRLLMAVPEERVSQRKYDGGFSCSLRYCLGRLNIRPDDLAAVVVSTFGQPTTGDGEHQRRITEVISESLGRRPPVVFAPSHHECHAIGAAALCSFEVALIAVVDNEGSIIGPRVSDLLWHNKLERTSFFLLNGNNLDLIGRDHDEPMEVGLGKAYSKATRYIGFGSYLESGKTMGLAPFGSPGLPLEVPLFRIGPDGRSRTTLSNTEDGLADLDAWFRRSGYSPPGPRPRARPVRRIDAQIAFWMQRELETTLTNRIQELARQYRCQNLCMAGGVAMNSVLNRKLSENPSIATVFVPPAPGDSGMAVGAAAWYFWQTSGAIPRWKAGPYLGGAYSLQEIESAISACPLKVASTEPTSDAAMKIRDGQIVGWFQGASEYGPRALGNRSIFANPASAWAKEVLNHGVKGREWFRPYAPAVLESRAADFFDLAEPEPFMMKIANAHKHTCQALPSCVHVDGTARLQTVSQNTNVELAELLQNVEAATGFPVLLNTSFNLAGEPIVETPSDAINSFMRSEWMDVLYLGPYRLTKR